VVQVRTIARTLFDSAVDKGIPAAVNRQIAEALSAASFAISAKAENMSEVDGVSDTLLADEVRLAGATLADKLIEDSSHVDHDQLVRSISLVTNIERIADSLDETSPALSDVKTPDEPAQNKVLKISIRGQIKLQYRRIKAPIYKTYKKYF